MIGFAATLGVGAWIWLGLVGAHGLIDLGAGLLVVLSGWGLLVRLLGRAPGIFSGNPVRRAYLLIRFFILDVVPSAVHSTFQVIGPCLLPSRPCRPSIIRVELGPLSPPRAFLFSFALSLSPGDQVIDLDEASGTVYIHTFATDLQRFRQRVMHQYARYVKEIVP